MNLSVNKIKLRDVTRIKGIVIVAPVACLMGTRGPVRKIALAHGLNPCPCFLDESTHQFFCSWNGRISVPFLENKPERKRS